MVPDRWEPWIYDRYVPKRRVSPVLYRFPALFPIVVPALFLALEVVPGTVDPGAHLPRIYLDA